MLFHKNNKVHQSSYSLLLSAYFSSCKALNLVFLPLAEYHLKHMLKKPTIRNSYQFPEWHNWKVDDGSSILSGLVVKLYNSK